MASGAEQILLMAILAVIMREAAATARNLAAPSSMDLTNTANEDEFLQWLKITAVPLVVFLMGACTWHCIKNTALWKRLTRGGVESPNVLLDSTANSSSSSNGSAPDLEVGLEMSHLGNMDEELATARAQDLTVQQHPALEAPHDDEKSAIPKVTIIPTKIYLRQQKSQPHMDQRMDILNNPT